MKTTLFIITSIFFSTLQAADDTCEYNADMDSSDINYAEKIFELLDVLDAKNDTEFNDKMLALINSLPEETTTVSKADRWVIELSRSLIYGNDINIKLQALNYLNFHYADKMYMDSGNPVLSIKEKMSILNDALHSDLVSFPSLLLARMMCSEDDVQSQCKVDDFSLKLYGMDPKNLDVYYTDLEHAVNNKDQELIDVVLKQMSQAEYSSIINPITEDFLMAVRRYINKNPVPEFQPEKILYALTGFVADSTSQEVIYNSIIQSFYMSNLVTISSYKPLSVACQEYQTDLQPCLSITDTMIDHSDVSISKHIGYSFKEMLLERHGDAKSWAEAKAAKSSYQEYTYCLIKNHVLIDDQKTLFNNELMDLMIQSNHEGTFLEQAALFIYDHLKNSGVEGLVDPKSLWFALYSS